MRPQDEARSLEDLFGALRLWQVPVVLDIDTKMREELLVANLGGPMVVVNALDEHDRGPVYLLGGDMLRVYARGLSRREELLLLCTPT